MEYTEKDLSQWFDLKKQKPWEDGVYEIRNGNTVGTSFWDGSKFCCAWVMGDTVVGTTFQHALRIKDRSIDKFERDITHWRGLNFKPANPKKQANKRKTMYVVVNVRKDKPCAAFDKVNDARDYAERVNFPVRVIRTRFRVPA